MRSIARVPAVLALALVAGCSGPVRQKHAGTAADPWVIGMSQCNLGEPWRVQMEEFIDQGVDLLIISPKEAAPLTEPVAEAYRKGIPVIVLDRGVQGDEYTEFIGGNNVLIGREAGKFIRNLLGGKGRIVELEGLMTSTPGQQRHEGFLQGLDLEDNPGLKIVYTGEMQWLEPNARTEMESALATNDHIDVVFSHNDPGAHGAWLAAKAAGRDKEMKFVGIDGLPQEGQQYVAQGILDATFLYPTGGDTAVAQALKILAGQEVPKKIVLGTRIFTKDNVAQGGEAISPGG
jgi:ribose transport system substrate-binding protein